VWDIGNLALSREYWGDGAVTCNRVGQPIRRVPIGTPRAGSGRQAHVNNGGAIPDGSGI